MKNTEKIAYIKGMMDGMNFEADSPEKKLISSIVDALESIAESLEALESDTEYLSDYIEEVDQDLGDIEEEVFGYEDDDYEDDDYEDDDYDDNEDEDEDDEDYYEVVDCPNCGKKIVLEEVDLECGRVTCPSCETEFEIETDCDGCEGCGR